MRICVRAAHLPIAWCSRREDAQRGTARKVQRQFAACAWTIDFAAFFGDGLSAAGRFLLGSGNILFGYGLLLWLRVVNYTAGRAAALLDRLDVIGLGVLLTLLGNCGLGMLAGIGALITLRLAARRGVWLPAEGANWVAEAAALGLALLS